MFWVRNVVRETLAGNSARRCGSREGSGGQRAPDRRRHRTLLRQGGDGPAVRAAGRPLRRGQAVPRRDRRRRARPEQDEALQALTANAGEIARFLSGANPNLPFDTVNGLLLAHGGHHVQQIQQIKAGQFAEEARTWNDDEGPHVHHRRRAGGGHRASSFRRKFVAQARLSPWTDGQRRPT
ncbi:MAG: hypothetical protein MZW92_15445 [Comamonadaceae bacterium]|nr:hypothetical protein [Comamonadaceae bacterium]